MLLRTPEIQTLFKSYDKNKPEYPKAKFFPMEKSAAKFIRKIL